MKRVLKFSPYLILFFGFALRLYHLGANSLWYDETVSLYLAQSDLAELLRHTAGDIHPPLYYLLLHGWGRLAGWSEFAAAFFSLWFGVVLIALVYRITREWFGSAVIATAAALMIAVSPYNVWYSQEVRMYTLGATLGLLSVYFLRRMLHSGKIISRDFVAYVVITVLGFYTLYYFVFLMVFEWLWVGVRLWQMANGRQLERNIKTSPLAVRSTLHAPPTPLLTPLSSFLLSQLALVLLYLPWLPIAFRQATDPPVPPWREFIALPRALLETFSALAFGQAVDPNLFGFVALLLYIPIGILLWREWQTRRTAFINQPALRDTPSAFFLFAYTFIPLIAIYLFSLWKPLYHVRYMFLYAPAFYILAAYAVVNLAREFLRLRRANQPRWFYGAGTLALLSSLGFFIVAGYSLYNFWNDPHYAEDDLRGAVNYIAERWRPGDVILVNAGYAYPALVYYFPETLERERLSDYQTPETTAPLVLQTGSIGGASSLGWGDPRSDFYATNADETRAALDRVFANHPRVWMLRIYDTVVDPSGVIRAYFDRHATLLDDQPFSGESQTRVQGYITSPTRELPAGAMPVNKNLGDRVELIGYESGARELARGDALDIVLYWKLSQSVNFNYQVTLQLLNARGENVAQYDETPLSDVLPMTRWQNGELYREPLRLHIPQDLAPGEYQAIAKLYNPRSGEVLGDVIQLGKIQVR